MPMNTRLCFYALLVVALSAQTPLALGAPQEEGFSFKDAYALLKKHCEVCHDGGAPAERPVSQFDVGRVQEPSSLVEEAPLWKRVLTKVRDEEMPPPGRPAPTKEERAALVKWLEGALKQANGAARAVPRFAGESAGDYKGAAAAAASTTAWLTSSWSRCGGSAAHSVKAVVRAPVRALDSVSPQKRSDNPHTFEQVSNLHFRAEQAVSPLCAQQ